MTEKILTIGISSFFPKKYSKKFWKNRAEDYYLSIKSLYNLNLNLDFYVFDNTINKIEEIPSRKLKKLLMEQLINYPIIIDKFFGYKDDYNRNNDRGYLDLLLKVSEKISSMGNEYSHITIINLRRYFISSYWFDMVNNLIISDKYDILLVSNKQTELKTMKVTTRSIEAPINDFIFTMKIDSFIDYVNFIKKQSLTQTSTSQDVLWHFSKDRKFKILENVGIMRNDWDTKTQGFKLTDMYFS
jgi:hypothetical protein